MVRGQFVAAQGRLEAYGLAGASMIAHQHDVAYRNDFQGASHHERLFSN